MNKYHKIKNYATKYHKQVGMTLIELTVVLLVLIGLAGLLMPYVSGFTEKTHDSTGASNLSAVNGAMLQYQASYQQFPDRLDSLIDDSATPAVYSKLMGPQCLTAQPLGSMQAMPFTMAGIDNIMQMNSATVDATFASTTGTEIQMMGTPTVAMLTGLSNCNMGTVPALTDTDLAKVITRKPNIAVFDYVVFGIGDDSSLVGKTVTTAPVHFAQTGNMGPKLKYNRFGVVFEVPKNSVLMNGGYCEGQRDTDGALIASQPTTESNCGLVGTGGTGGGTATVGVWTKAQNAIAKYAGSIMLMSRIEGQTAALQNHYDKASEG